MLESFFKKLTFIKSATLNERGQEVNDPTRLFLRSDGPPSISEQIKRMVRHELSGLADGKGFETFEESNDFDVDDDFDADEKITQYQELEEEMPKSVRKLGKKKEDKPSKKDEKPLKEESNGPLKSPLDSGVKNQEKAA